MEQPKATKPKPDVRGKNKPYRGKVVAVERQCVKADGKLRRFRVSVDVDVPVTHHPLSKQDKNGEDKVVGFRAEDPEQKLVEALLGRPVEIVR